MRSPAFLALVLVFAVSATRGQGQWTIDWSTVDNEVASRLKGGDRNLVDWANEVLAEQPAGVEQGLTKLDVLMRAALDREAAATARALGGLDTSTSNGWITRLYDVACHKYAAWEVARALVETFAARISHGSIEDGLIRHFEADGWSVAEVDGWLAEMEALALEGRQAEDAEALAYAPFTPPDPVKFWRRTRFGYLKRRDKDRLADLVYGMEAAARAAPGESGPTVAYLEALSVVPPELRGDPGLSWITGARFARSTSWERVADRLQSLGQWTPAAECFAKAAEIPLTEDEVRVRSSMMQRMIDAETLRIGYRVHLLERRAKCLLEAGDAEGAQELVDTVAAICERHPGVASRVLAGAVEADSGTRVIESRILGEEAASGDDPGYWIRRARYYGGRDDPESEEAAYLAGLRLSEALPRPPGKSSSTHRATLLRGYGQFLEREKRFDDAVALMVGELADAPADAESSEAAAWFLAFDLPGHLDPDEPVLWTWLDRRPQWRHIEGPLLWRMLERSAGEERVANFGRAERLARGTDPSRAATLGWILNRMEQPGRALPLLRDAARRAEIDRDRERATFSLFETCLDLGDWRSADRLFDDASARLSPSEYPYWLGRVALLAARDGALDDALRIFERVANMDLRTGLADDLADAGMRGRLAGFYADVARRLPPSEAIAQIRASLEAP